MKITVGRLLELVGAALRPDSSGQFAKGAALRKLDQLCALVTKTGMSEIQVEIPVPKRNKRALSGEGKRVLEKLQSKP